MVLGPLGCRGAADVKIAFDHAGADAIHQALTVGATDGTTPAVFGLKFLIVPLLGTLRVLVVYLLKKIVQQDPFPGEDPPLMVDLDKL